MARDGFMQALSLQGGAVRYRTDHPIPRLDGRDAIVRVELAGICGTDLALAAGYKDGFAGVLGHEFVGVVERAADPSWRGRRVTAMINVGCHACPECVSRGPAHCPGRAVIGILGRDGAFAEYVAAPIDNLIAVPDGVPDRRAVFAEPLAAALRIREQIAVRPSGAVAVIGPGRLGMLIGKVLALSGTEVIMIGRRPESLALARTWGLDTALARDVPDRCMDLVVEATGNPAGLDHALRVVRPMGTVIMKSTFASPAALDLSPIVVAEIALVGSRCGPFAPALRLLQDQAIDVEALIDGEYALCDGAAAFEHAARPGARKILLRPRRP